MRSIRLWRFNRRLAMSRPAAVSAIWPSSPTWINASRRRRLIAMVTAAGRDIANRLLNRHHLIERMLTEIFDLEWYKVHDEAEQLEHAVSADFERKLIDKLGTASVCPHGNQVGMDSPSHRRQRGLKPLEEARPGDRLVVVSVCLLY